MTFSELRERAAALHQAGDLAAAEPLWRQVVSEQPSDAPAWCNLGIALMDTRRLEAAEPALRKAAELKPDAPWAQEHLGRLLMLQGRYPEAIEPLKRAARIQPRNPWPRLNIGYALLALGEYPRGWAFYEARKETGDPRYKALDLAGEWQGEDLAGKRLLVWPEQGYGDMIQFARFLPLLRQRGAHVTFACPPPLMALFEGLGVELVERGPETEFALPDHWAMMMSLAGRLGVDVGSVPNAPYLTAPADRLEKWGGFAPRGAVGVAWRGSAGHPNDSDRSLPDRSLLAPLEAAGRPLIDLDERLGDFADTAAVIDQLDLVITVDTSVAHLAGAMGKPCWVLLPWFRPDWRWMRGRTDSPWYPSVRLFRQPAMGDWGTPIAQAAAALAAL